MKHTPLLIVIFLFILVNTLIENAEAQFSSKDKQRYAERIAVTRQLEEYAKQAYTINDILKDVAFIRYKRWEESDIAKEKRSLEQQKDKPRGFALPIIMPELDKKYIIEQETKKNLKECQYQLANIFRYYANIPVNDIAKAAGRIEKQIPRNAIDDRIKIDSDTAIMLTFEFIKDYCRKEVAKMPRRR